MKYTFAEKLRKLRKQEGASMKEFSRRTKISYNTLVSLELRRVKTPLLTTVIKLAKYFNMTLDEILKDVKL